MSNDRLERVNELFDRAAEMPASRRRLFLEQACDGDDRLLAEVEALLAADAAAGQFLSEPTIADAHHAAAKVIGSETAGSRIGHYTLLEPLGDGGFGTVFLAEQKYPVRRKVAIKIIKLGMDTRQVISRFEAERQALAMMDHPGIARVFDAGSTDTGRPYFVMEYVAGESITRYCDRERLTVKARLSLFVSVCQAVQHAHQKGIIHRDLKPSNVLVTVVDGQPVAKVIDFGIAKAASPSLRLTEATMHTQQDQFLGTPKYMSPEQATVGGGEDVDTRSDVYSLGVMLYELLVGTTPFDDKSLRNATYADLQRVIREVEPQRPSTKLSAMRETVRDIAAVRGMSDPKQLRSALRGELDWIVMKCLEKERARRYDSASALSADLQRYVRNEPVEAGPPTRRYRLRKFVLRHRGTVAAASLVLAVLVGGIITTALAAYRANRAEQLAVRERERMLEQKLLAERRFNDVRKLAGSFIFEVDDAIQKQGPTKAREKLVNTALEYLDALSKESTDPDLLRELQESYRRVGMVQYFSTSPSIGDPAGAIQSYRKSLELAQRRLALAPDDRKIANDVAGAWYYLAEAQFGCNQEAEAQRSLDEAEKVYRALAERYPKEFMPRRNTNLVVNRRGAAMQSLSRNEEALHYFRQAMEMREALLAEFPDEPMLQRDARVSNGSVAMMLVLLGRPDEAQAYLRKTLTAIRAAVAANPGDSALRRELNSVLHRLAEATRESGQVAESLALTRELVANGRKRIADDPQDSEAPMTLSGALYTLGRGHLMAGPLNDALQAFEESLRMRQEGMKFNAERTTERWVSDSQWRVTETLRRMGRYEQALAAAREAVAVNERRLVATPEVVTVWQHLLNTRCELAMVLSMLDQPDAALAALELPDPPAVGPSTAPATRPAVGPIEQYVAAIDLASLAATKGEVLFRAGRYEQARIELERSIAYAADAEQPPVGSAGPATAPSTAPSTAPGERGVRPPRAPVARALLARTLAALGRLSEAEAELTPLLADLDAYVARQPDLAVALEVQMYAFQARYELCIAKGDTAGAADAARAAVALARRLLSDPDHAAARAVLTALEPSAARQ